MVGGCLASAHPAKALQVRLAVLRMHEVGEGLADQLGLRPAEQGAIGGVDAQQPPGRAIHLGHGGGGLLEGGAELRLALAQILVAPPQRGMSPLTSQAQRLELRDRDGRDRGWGRQGVAAGGQHVGTAHQIAHRPQHPPRQPDGQA